MSTIDDIHNEFIPGVLHGGTKPISEFPVGVDFANPTYAPRLRGMNETVTRTKTFVAKERTIPGCLTRESS